MRLKIAVYEAYSEGLIEKETLILCLDSLETDEERLEQSRYLEERMGIVLVEDIADENVTKNRKFPMYILNIDRIYTIVRGSDEGKTSLGIKRSTVVEIAKKEHRMPKTTAYDCISRLREEGIIYLDAQNRLHVNGNPRPVKHPWQIHDIDIKFNKAMDPMGVVNFCDYLNEIYFNLPRRKAIPNPTNWKEQDQRKLKCFRISCTNRPFYFEELRETLHTAMKKYFGRIPQFKIRGEINQDVEDPNADSRCIPWVVLSKLGRMMRTYRKNKKKRKEIVQNEFYTMDEEGEILEEMGRDANHYQDIIEQRKLSRIIAGLEEKLNRVQKRTNRNDL